MDLLDRLVLTEVLSYKGQAERGRRSDHRATPRARHRAAHVINPTRLHATPLYTKISNGNTGYQRSAKKI